MANIEHVAHIHVNDRDFNVYISFVYSSLTLQAYKYNDTNIEFDWFDNVTDFQHWLEKPIG